MRYYQEARMNNFYKKTQFGRSMVEMLGVLAIIGVLSVAGIAGYTKAMRRHNVNELAETFNEFISAYATLEEMPNTNFGMYDFTNFMSSMNSKCKFGGYNACNIRAGSIYWYGSHNNFHLSIQLSKDICADFMGYNWHKIIPEEWGKSMRLIALQGYYLLTAGEVYGTTDNYNMQGIAEACNRCTDNCYVSIQYGNW